MSSFTHPALIVPRSFPQYGRGVAFHALDGSDGGAESATLLSAQGGGIRPVLVQRPLRPNRRGLYPLPADAGRFAVELRWSEFGGNGALLHSAAAVVLLELDGGPEARVLGVLAAVDALGQSDASNLVFCWCGAS